jgi:hypothetical protein
VELSPGEVVAVRRAADLVSVAVIVVLVVLVVFGVILVDAWGKRRRGR